MDSPEQLARIIREFLAEVSSGTVWEDGVPAFDLAQAHYALSTEHGKCTLHFWSAERNAVRRVIGAEVKHGSLRLQVLRFGQAKPAKLEICRESTRLTPSQRDRVRSAYGQRLRALLERNFAGYTIAQLTGRMDLERSFGPVYTRGWLRRGGSGWAVLGVNAQETQAAIDGAVTFGVLWLHYCRERAQRDRAHPCYVEGLNLFVPAGTGAVVRERTAHLNRSAAHWQLYEFDEREGCVARLDTADRGNVATRLTPYGNPAAVRERFSASIRRVLEIAPAAEIAVLSSTEVAFRMHGLELARTRLEASSGGLRPTEEILFGTGLNETVLTAETAGQFAELASAVANVRRPQGPHADPLWRMVPERWLESAVVRDVTAIDERLDPACVYSQVPAFAGGDRGMIDVLGTTREGRLAVLELKADEDIHLPLQGIDYWARVEWHRARNEFQSFGYFPGRQLAAEKPLLLLVAPALHVHPATDTLLHYLAPEIDCTLVGIDEHWREGLKVVFRKKREELGNRVIAESGNRVK
jgi:hypothetical protein